MNKVFDRNCFKGIVDPGDTYILRDEWDVDRMGVVLGGLYAIRTDAEVFFAILMYIMALRREYVEVRKCLGIKKLRTEDDYVKSYQIRLLCRNNNTGQLFIERLILESLRTFEEDFEWLKKHYPWD